MPALESMFKKILGAGSEIGERFSARAEKGAERNAEGEITKPGMNIFDNAAMSYHETMLGKNSSLARKSMGYGVPGVIGAGMGIGAYNEAQNGNTGGAAILGAGAAVMGGALALSHFGGVAEKSVGAKVAEGLSKGLQPPSAKMAEKDIAQARTVVSDGKYSGHRSDDLSDAALDHARGLQIDEHLERDKGNLEKSKNALDLLNVKSENMPPDIASIMERFKTTRAEQDVRHQERRDSRAADELEQSAQKSHEYEELVNGPGRIPEPSLGVVDHSQRR